MEDTCYILFWRESAERNQCDLAAQPRGRFNNHLSTPNNASLWVVLSLDLALILVGRVPSFVEPKENGMFRIPQTNELSRRYQSDGGLTPSPKVNSLALRVSM